MAFAVAMAATPGPNNAMVAASGATWGLPAHAAPHARGLGGIPGDAGRGLALGAGELLRTRPWAHEALRWVGAAYLLWLAWHIAVSRPKAPAESKDSAGPAQVGGRPLGFMRAALFQWMNPGAWVIAVGAVVTYTTSSGLTLLVQAILLAAIFLVIILPTIAVWTLIGVGAAAVLRTPRALRRFNLAMAALLVASLLPLLRGE